MDPITGAIVAAVSAGVAGKAGEMVFEGAYEALNTPVAGLRDGAGPGRRTLGGVMRPFIGILDPSARQLHDEHKSGGNQPANISMINRR